MSIRSFTVGTSTGAGFVTLNKPTGLANGDVLVIALTSDGSISATTTWPSGFSAERGFATNSTSAQRLRYATKKITDATSEPASYTVNFSPSDHASAIAIAVQGQGDFNVGNTTGAGSGTSTSIAVPGVTPPGSSELIWLAATYPSSLTYTPPSGMTTIGGTTTQYSSITAASKVHSTGATGTQTGSTNSAGNGMGVMLAIEPPPPAPTLSSAGRDTITSTGARVTATSDLASGTFYVAVSTSATPPTAAQIKAGSGGSIVAAGNAALASGANAVSVTGLSPSTTYYGYAVANNGSDSNIVSTASFTTSAVAPVRTGASINAAGTQLTVVHSAAVTNGAGGSGGVSLTATNGAVTATYASGAGTASLVYNLSRVVMQSETVTQAYTQPGNGIEASSDGQDVATYTAQAVTNGSTIAPPNVTGTAGSPAHLGTLTINVTNAGSTQGTGSVTIGGTACSVVSWSDTAIQVSVSRGLNKYGQALNIVVTKDGGLVSAPYSLAGGILPAAGWGYVDIATPNATASQRLTSTPDLATGDQVSYNTQSGAVTVYDDATFSADAGVASFPFEVWTSPDGWGATAVQTLSGVAGSTGIVAALLAAAF